MIGVSSRTAPSGAYVASAGSAKNVSACDGDLTAAILSATAAVCGNTLTTAEIGGLTLKPGVYCTAPGTYNIAAGAVTLDGLNNTNAVWLFQAKTTLTTAAATSFVLINGARAKNVYWMIGSSGTLGAGSTMVGTILASTSMTFGSGSILNGRALVGVTTSFESGSTVNLP